MDSTRDLNEDAYDAEDDEAYEGMDAYLGDEDAPGTETIYGIQINAGNADDDDDDDDDDYIDEDDEGSDEEDAHFDEPDADMDSTGDTLALFEVEENHTSDSAINRVLAFIRAGGSGRSAGGRVSNSRTRTTAAEDDSPEPAGLDNPYSRRKWVQSWWKKPHIEPQPAGVGLLMSGEFGRVGRKPFAQRDNRSSFTRVLRERSRRTQPMPKQDLCEHMVPNSAGAVVAKYPASVYCGQFSADSSFYYVCCKDFNLHIYDMTARRNMHTKSGKIHVDSNTGHATTLKVHKSIHGIPEGWTITDSHLSPDNERMIYSSMSPTVHMVKTLEYDSTQVPINFSDGGRRSFSWGWGDDSVIWSCRFSADGNEVIAGGRGKIFVYDLLANRRTVKISAHTDDVNSCCWADSGSNVLISASDDTFIKVWDRRSLGSSSRPSGVLIGHTEGITNVSAKGDGRYVISNGKDQALRLWDLRKMASDSVYRQVKDILYGLDDFDYRYLDQRPQKRPAHPKDCSVMTYRGHSVMRTLIRCHFSPAESTGSRYIYSGSVDGKVYIWSLDGRVVQILDRSNTLPMGFDPSAPVPPSTLRTAEESSCVRDVSWHAHEPVMLSAAWGTQSTSSVAWHEWKGLSKMGGRLEDWEEKRVQETRERRTQTNNTGPTPLRRSSRLSAAIPGAFWHYASSDDEGYEE